MAETDCDVVHCPTVGNKHWMFDLRLADVVNQFAVPVFTNCTTLPGEYSIQNMNMSSLNGVTSGEKQ